MKFIDKTKAKYRVKGLDINREMLNAQWDGRTYFNLHYETVDKAALTRLLIEEQEGLCCYCMRRLHIQDEGNYRKNVTLEHVIPHKIKQEEWEHDREQYRKFSQLNDRNVTVCMNGIITDPTNKFGMPPFPHFLAYDNLVASCNGRTLDESRKEVPHHCCNNMRGNYYVEPLYFHSNVSTEIIYDGRGHIQCDEEYVPYLQEKNGINIMSPFLNDVRLFWKQVADSDYIVEQIHEAENDEGLRFDIIDDIFTNDPTGHWLFLEEQTPWCIFSDYDWFYSYYYKAEEGA